MAELVMIMGESGSGKSASLRTFRPGEVCVLNVAGKRLPFRNEFGKSVIMNARYNTILAAVRSGKFKVYVVDDSQYLMAYEVFDRVKERGYDKFTEMAYNFYSLLQGLKTVTRYERVQGGIYRDTGEALDDTIVYFMHHTDVGDDGVVRPKTLGKMLNTTLNWSGLFTTVLMTKVDSDGHWFLTENNGESVVKAPIDMFAEAKIPNDLRMVDRTIRMYYGMDDIYKEAK